MGLYMDIPRGVNLLAEAGPLVARLRSAIGGTCQTKSGTQMGFKPAEEPDSRPVRSVSVCRHA